MRLKLYAYKVQIVQEIKRNDKPLREQFPVDLLVRIDQDEHFLRNVVFSDEATSTCLVKLTDTVAGYGDLKTPVHSVSMSVIAPE
jgi:hypothetical protein